MARTTDGSYNDLRVAGHGHGRHPVRPQRAARDDVADSPAADLLDPNPRTVSTELLLRREFIPAPTLNVLAAAWLQFQTRDWFSHGTDTSRLHRGAAPGRRRLAGGPDPGAEHAGRPAPRPAGRGPPIWKAQHRRRVVILKNNQVEAVIVPVDDYEKMAEALDLLEHMEHSIAW